MWYKQSLCAALTVTCCTFKNLDPISLPGIAYPLATMLTLLWVTLRCCMTLYCVVRLGLIMSWPNMFQFGSPILHVVVASGPTIWTSTYGLEPVLCNRLFIEPSGWAQTVHMFTQRFMYHVTQYSRRLFNAFFFSPFCACIYDLAEPYFGSFLQ